MKKTLIGLIFFIFIIFFPYQGSAFFADQNKAENKDTKTNSKKESDEVDRRIIVVEIYAKWCPLCRNIEPTLDLLLKEEPDINFVKLDVSTQENAETSEKTAKKLKILDFYNSYKSKTSTVAVFVPSTKEIISSFHNDNDVEKYKTAIKDARTKEKSLEVE